MSNSMVAEKEAEVTTPMAVPDGFELSFDMADPVWFGPMFEESFSQWDFGGVRVWAVVNGDSPTGPMNVAFALELHRQLDGLLSAMGLLPGSNTA